MKLKHIAAVLLAAFLVGCVTASVDITKTGKGFYDKTNASEVEILKTRPERPYEELGTITATGFTPGDTAVMHNAIRTKSAALGANAVILTEEGVIVIEDGLSRKITKWSTGVAIRYK